MLDAGLLLLERNLTSSTKPVKDSERSVQNPFTWQGFDMDHSDNHGLQTSKELHKLHFPRFNGETRNQREENLVFFLSSAFRSHVTVQRSI